MRYNNEEILCAIGLLNITGLGVARIGGLLKEFGSPLKVVNADFETLAQSLGDRIATKIKDANNSDWAKKQLEQMEKLCADILILNMDGYPEALANIINPPPVLFTLGELLPQDARAIAVVGTRKPTFLGEVTAKKISHELVSAGITIVSGLAVGIDGIAHKSALDAGGRTIAVLGSGLDIIYPASHREMAKRIIQQGAIISEFPFGTKPEAYNFPRRNRIISGLSLGVLVVEGGLDSGALITAAYAIEQGREVFAIPGSPESAKSKGTNKLIKDGAKIVTEANDILEELKVPSMTPAGLQKTVEQIKRLSGTAKIIFDILTNEPMHIDDIARACKMDTAFVLSALLSLELQGIIRQLPGKRFVRDV